MSTSNFARLTTAPERILISKIQLRLNRYHRSQVLQQGLSADPFHGRACRWAMFGELKPKGPKGRGFRLCWEHSKSQGCIKIEPSCRISSSVRLWCELKQPFESTARLLENCWAGSLERGRSFTLSRLHLPPASLSSVHSAFGFGFRVSGFGFRVLASEFWGFEFWVCEWVGTCSRGDFEEEIQGLGEL